MMSQTGPQIVTLHILPNIATIKSNQAMKFGQLRSLFVFQKSLFKAKGSCQHFSFNIFW